MMKNSTIVAMFLLLFLFAPAWGQNLILNPDFEDMSSCPTSLGMVTNAFYWNTVVQSSDYYNCGLTTSIFPTSSGAYSGTGYMGFASYGNSNIAAEAIGQTLAQPLLPGNSYILSFAVKMVTGGPYSDICGGLSVYGMRDNMPDMLISTHISQEPNTFLIDTTNVITNTDWESYTFNFIPADTIGCLIFTVGVNPSCGQCLFLDSLNLYVDVTGIHEIANGQQFSVFPNPFVEFASLKSSTTLRNATLIITDQLGRICRIMNGINGTTIEIPRGELNAGFYFARIISEGRKDETIKLVAGNK